MVSFALTTQQAIGLLACSFVVNGLVINPPSNEAIAKRSGAGFVKLDFDVTKNSVFQNGTTNNEKRGDASAILKNNKLYYSINLNFGSQDQSISVDLDTGSSDLWVPDLSAASGGFDSAASKTLKRTDKPFSIKYLDQSYSNGTFVFDTVGIPGGPSLNQFQFADVNFTTVKQGGILGIAPVSREANNASYPNFPISLKNAGFINKNAYSIYLNGINATSGSIIFGGIDHAKYEGELITRPLTLNSAIALTLDSVSAPGGSDIPINAQSIYDTGTSVTYLPENVISAISSSIQGSFDYQGIVFLPSCSLPSDQYVSFKFGDATIKVPLSDFVLNIPDNNGQPTSSCILSILGNSLSSGINLLGDTFLRRAYFVADFDSESVQIAQVKFTSDSNIVAIN